MDVFSQAPDGYEDGEEVLVFHHQKGEFRKYEQKIYRDMATGENQPKRGFFRALVGTRGNRLMLITLIACVVIVFVLGMLKGNANEAVIGKLKCELSALSFQDDVYVTLSLKKAGYRKKTTLSQDAKDGPMHVVAQFKATDGSEKETDSALGEMLLDTRDESTFKPIQVSFSDASGEISGITCVLSAAGEERTVKCSIKRN